MGNMCAGPKDASRGKGKKSSTSKPSKPSSLAVDKKKSSDPYAGDKIPVKKSDAIVTVKQKSKSAEQKK